MDRKIPVFDDNTVDAFQIGVAATAEEAADVYVARMQIDSPGEVIERPRFQRCGKDTYRERGPYQRRVDDSDFFEPIF